ncbi:hypothetical protein PR003_g15306 [Phytophthora rubi]|uniref:Uncharacterized protein n=1 Tax=Phytophthora rubi TaxID=129364 RepID=A0A6A3L799_9STRA|nr:hypothetical protein PR002_g14950 [Phytophthora rubi]KAE9017072.1 hypothetical protein PR001_g14500 [Phytophthora rubi]KAE9330453.1 hypothetical protein PR003_g15306 [Phytophthora rubi]
MSDSTSRLCREGDDEHVDNQVTQAKKPLCFDDFEWEMKKVERAGKDINAPVIISIRDKNPLDTQFLELRDFSIANSIRGYKNKKKDVLLSLIAQRMKNNKIYGRIFRAKKMKDRNEPEAKQIQCPFRLINIIFSSHFASRFVSLCDQRSRADLDAAVSAEDTFWEDVLAAFLDSACVEEYDNLVAAHHAFDPDSINPSHTVRHSKKQLRQMWGSSHGAYRHAHIRFTTSGTNGEDFYK